MHISEISGGDVGSLNGLGQTKSGQVFGDAGIAGYATQLRMGVKAKAQTGQLQMLLTRLGYPVTVDGVFGAATDTAVKAIQGKLSRPQTGIYDEALDDQVVNASPGLLAPTRKEVQITVAAPQVKTPASQVIIEGGSTAGSQVVTYQNGGGFLDNLMAAARRQPAIFAAGAALLVVGALILLPRLRARMQGGTKAVAPVQTMGLGEAPKRKKRKSKAKKKRCPDCGEPGEVRGHQTCQYPQ